MPVGYPDVAAWWQWCCNFVLVMEHHHNGSNHKAYLPVHVSERFTEGSRKNLKSCRDTFGQKVRSKQHSNKNILSYFEIILKYSSDHTSDEIMLDVSCFLPFCRLISSAEKLLAEGEASYLEGDEELSYVYFCRYIEAVTSAQKKDDYKKDKAFYDKLLPPKTIHSAFEKLEKITNSLQKRYAFKKEIENADSVAREKEISDALQQLQQKNRSSGTKDEGSLSSGDGVKSSLSNINGVIKTNGVDGPRNGGITPHELKTLLEQKTKRFLLVDCRDKQDFIKNHINHSNCICIPATILERGYTLLFTFINIFREWETGLTD